MSIDGARPASLTRGEWNRHEAVNSRREFLLRYAFGFATVPLMRISCSTPGGIHSARCGGTTQVPPFFLSFGAVLIRITPRVA